MQLSLSPLRSAFANRRFGEYLGAALASDAGFWISLVAQGWLVERLTNAPLWLGIVASAAQAPALAVSLAGGILADRADRRAVILATNLTVALLAAAAAFLIGSGRITVLLLALLELGIGTMLALEHPVDRAFLYDLVHGGEVQEAVALSSAEFSLARTGGPALGGLAIGALGVAAGYGLYALCALPAVAFAGAALLRGFGKRREPAAAAGDASFGEAWAYLRRERTILAVCALTAIFTIGVSPYVVLLADVAKHALHVGERGYGLLQAAAGCGALAGAVLLALLGETRGRRQGVIVAVAAGGALLAVFALVRSVPIAALLLAVLGVADTLVYALGNTLVQERVEPRYRGRANAVFTSAFLGGIPVGNLLLGAVAQRAGSETALFGAGCAVAAAAAAMRLFVPALREAG